MAPAHSTHPRVQQHQQHQQRDQSANSDIVEHGLFLEPMMGTPLAMYVHKDVPDHDRVVELITVSPSAVRRYDSYAYPPSRVFALIFKKYNSSQWLCDLFLGCLLSRAVQCSHSVLPEKRRQRRQLLQWRHLYLRYEKIRPIISQMTIHLTITLCNSEPAHGVWTEFISSIYWKEGQGSPGCALGT